MPSIPKYVVLVIGLLVAGHVGHAFQLNSDVLSSGGTKMTSAGYSTEGSFSQLTASSPWLTSTGFQAIIGFWHPLTGGPGIEERSEDIAFTTYTNFLYPNSPNPAFNHTTIQYSIARNGPVTLEVYNTLGQRITSLVDAKQMPGSYKITWDLCAYNIPAGVYFCRFQTTGYTKIRKIVVVN
jgi:hypothetical protein